jgi:hypothetical protein
MISDDILSIHNLSIHWTEETNWKKGRMKSAYLTVKLHTNVTQLHTNVNKIFYYCLSLIWNFRLRKKEIFTLK